MLVNNDISPMLTVREVARLLGIHANTVRRWSEEGKLRVFRITKRGDRLFKLEDINRFLTKMNKEKQTNPNNLDLLG